MSVVRRRAAAVAGIVALALVGLVLAGVGPAGRRADAAPLFQIEAAHAEHVPPFTGDRTIYILLIGSDARPDEDIERSRADSLHIVSFNPATGRSAILGFPRDAWVEIPGYGTNKINTSMVQGGPDLVVQTIELLTAITLDYWVLTSFEGLRAMIDDVGGLTLDIPFAMSDPEYSRAEFEPGVQTINGWQALAFARNRHDLPEGDFGRSENQGRLIIATLQQLHDQFADDLGIVLRYLAAGLRSTQTELPFDELVRLAFTAARTDPTTVQNVVVPGSAQMAGETSIVALAAEATVLFADMADDGVFEEANLPPSPNASLLD
ncbi:MAG: LCP family protein [Actinomycetota bacterium]